MKKYYLADLSPAVAKKVTEIEVKLNSETERLVTPEIQMRQLYIKDLVGMIEMNPTAAGADAYFVLDENSKDAPKYRFDYLEFF